MAVTSEKLIKLLNMDLELEYSAAIQYINHGAVMTGAAYGDIIKELKIHANEEVQHAMILADQIDYHQGSPSVSTIISTPLPDVTSIMHRATSSTLL